MEGWFHLKSEVKLNIGCFKDMFHHGWINIDIRDLSAYATQKGYSFRQLDVLKDLPYQDSSVGIILASHLLEHFSRRKGLDFLKECHRVLKENGLLRVAVPDARLIAEKYLRGTIIQEFREINVGVKNARDDAKAFFHLLLDGHETIYDEESLRQVLMEAGFKDIRKMPPYESQSGAIERETLPLHTSLSLYIEARKEIPAYRRYLDGLIEEGRQQL